MSTRNLEDVYPLSGMQQLMLLHECASSSASALSSRFVYRMTGDLDVAAFRCAWEQVVRRHVSLRTAFLWEGLDEPLQAVKREASVPFEQLDHRDLSDDRRQAELERLLEEDRQRRYDLRKPPLMRLFLIRTGEQAWTLVWSNHHLILDRWCLDPLFADLRVCYEGGGESGLPDTGSFRSYIDWLGARDQAEAESYWRAALRGFAAPTLIASGGDSSVAAGVRRQTESPLPAATFAAIREVAAAAKVSFGAAVQGAVALFLARETGRDDVVFGITVSGRPAELANVETIIGSFVNNIPARMRFPAGSTVEEWLTTIHSAEVKRAGHSHVSAAQIHQWSSVPLGQPLFDVLLLVGSPAAVVHEWAGLRIEASGGSLDSAYPAMVLVDEAAGKLALAFDPSRIDTQRAGALLERLALAFEDLSQNSSRPLSELGLPRSTTSESPAATRTRVPAGASAQETLLEIWRQALGRPDAGLDDDFFELGGTSLQAAQAFLAVEQRLGRRAPLSAFLEAGTVRAFARRLEDRVEPEPPPGLFELRARGSRPPLLLVPPALADPAALSTLTRELGDDQPIYGLAPPGLLDEREPETDFSRIVDYLLDAIEPVAEEPFVLGGVCWGAAVAFEMASRLAAAGAPPAGLALIFPTLIVPKQPKLASVTAAKAQLVRQRLSLYWKGFREARGTERWRYLREKSAVALRAAKSSDPFEPVQFEIRRIRADRAHRVAITGFDPRPYPGRTALFVSPPPHNAAWRAATEYWSKLAPADSSRYEIPPGDSDHGLFPSNSGAAARRLTEFVDEIIAARV